MMSSSLIINRDNPCTCGCRGTDPWHRKSYRRQVKDITIHAEPVVVMDMDKMEWTVSKTGFAKFPCGIVPVATIFEDGGLWFRVWD